MECPRCGKSCVRQAADILKDIDRLYMACPDCGPEPRLNKGEPAPKIDHKSIERCGSCGRAPLDLVMIEAMDTLIEAGFRDRNDPLRNVGSPMPAVGYPLAYPPRLGPGDLILLSDRIDETVAKRLIEIPEIKGVISGNGIPGVFDSNAGYKELRLLAGCDMRCDVVQSIFGDLVVYKSQSQIHIEFPRKGSPKVRSIEALNLIGKTVIDGLSGPGTLGLICALAGARTVIINDIWRPAVENVMLNLEVNSDELGLSSIEKIDSLKSMVASDPVHVGRATGSCTIDVYHGDLRKLIPLIGNADVCIIDHFPNAPISDLKRAASICKNVVII